MTDYPIDLSKKDFPGSVPISPMSGTSEKKYYPMVHLEWDESYDFPDSGEITFKFHKVSETNSKHGGKEHQSVTLDLLSIEDVEDKKTEDAEGDESEGEESTGDRLDKLAKEAGDEETD